MNVLFLSTIIAAFVGTALSAAEQVPGQNENISVVTYKESVSNAFAKLISGYTSPRYMDITDECLKELEQLGQNADLVAAGDALGNCPVSVDERAGTASIDYTGCSAVGPYQLACSAAGGKPGSVASFTISCQVWQGSKSGKITVSATNMPDCMGKSCGESLLEDHEVLKELEGLLEQEFRNDGFSYASCTVSSPASNTLPSKIALVGGFLFLFANAVL
mmetsp:Transcript_2211/g.4740  ORF Transcript_2211/g.4740 Transcript_2211/m.4740 type:complete len:219 (-) Transcript_2211:111-767(-)|eukprot:CAMPEP_0183706260 /NCGR_PEP_ID=MMETSP0737-20130205/3146_1 /TAXON_ID=385413 /ORGANISM="Thalassiosira miniscula, Strain CCMP1093" /LENGTH=218 /DNA_ID=CAMNT_0025933631 /DNA_START=103 /DNA_END=759 /DNA_ORIENTATION=-